MSQYEKGVPFISSLDRISDGVDGMDSRHGTHRTTWMVWGWKLLMLTRLAARSLADRTLCVFGSGQELEPRAWLRLLEDRRLRQGAYR